MARSFILNGPAAAGELATQLWFDGPNRHPEEVNATRRAEMKTLITELEKPDEFYTTIIDFLEGLALFDEPESDLATGLDGTVERKLVAPEPWKAR